jgi:hypothetical protein
MIDELMPVSDIAWRCEILFSSGARSSSSSNQSRQIPNQLKSALNFLTSMSSNKRGSPKPALTVSFLNPESSRPAGFA